MLSVGCPAAARLRLVVWCKPCDHRTEPDPAEIHAVWISLRPTPDRARQLRSWVVKFGVADRTAITAAVPPERSMAPGRNGYSDHRQADASLACRRREGEVPLPVTPAMPRTAFVPRYQRFESFSLQRGVCKLSVPLELSRCARETDLRQPLWTYVRGEPGGRRDLLLDRKRQAQRSQSAALLCERARPHHPAESPMI